MVAVYGLLLKRSWGAAIGKMPSTPLRYKDRVWKMFNLQGGGFSDVCLF